jgi:hypothetical protein
VEALVRGLVPDVAGRRRSGEAEVEFRGLPPDAVKEMALQFAAFSVGRMPPEEDAALRRALGEWPRVYWSVFPQEIRSIIKSYLENNLEEEVFLASIAVFFS